MLLMHVFFPFLDDYPVAVADFYSLSFPIEPSRLLTRIVPPFLDSLVAVDVSCFSFLVDDPGCCWCFVMFVSRPHLPFAVDS